MAEDWYLDLRDKNRRGELHNEKTFRDEATQFTREYEVITDGTRSKKWVEGHKARIRLLLDPFFGEMPLSQVTAGQVQEYRIHLMETAGDKPPAKSALNDEIVTLRQVLKTALRHDWVTHLPDFSAPYNTSTIISHRAWLIQATLLK